MENVFFDSWESVTRTFIITILAYSILILLLRISGKRTLSKMNAFDFIVTIALGSSLATVALNKNVAIVDGALAFFLLIFLQYAITWVSVRNKKVKRLITSKPTMLLYKGNIIPEVMKKERVTIEELYLAARQQGIANLKDVDVIVMETTGSINVIPKVESGDADALKDVRNYEE